MTCMAQTPFISELRRDKYQRQVKEYWVDTQTTGTFEDENEESFIDRTIGEGSAESFDLGLPAVSHTGFSPGEEPDTDQEVDDTVDDAASCKTKSKGKGDVDQEHALEAGAYTFI